MLTAQLIADKQIQKVFRFVRIRIEVNTPLNAYVITTSTKSYIPV